MMDIKSHELIQTIGTGTFGTIYLCKDRDTDHLVAIKAIEKVDLKSIDSLREVNIHSLVDHKNIAKLYSARITKNRLLLIMEYCNGKTLTEYIGERHFLTEFEAHAIFGQLLEAVRYLHGNLIIHRDIKPDNIIITRSGKVKLIDFGFADVYEPQKLINKFCGTPIFTSPEILTNKPYTGPEIDVWSLGICLYFMVHGTLPYKKTSLKSLIKVICTEPIHLKEDLSKPLKDLLEKMLIKDGSKRINMKEILDHDWLINGRYNNDVSIKKPYSYSKKYKDSSWIRALFAKIFSCC